MRTIIFCLSAGVLLAGCSPEAAKKPAEAKAAALQPGEYEVTTKVDALRGTDNSGASATQAKVGDTSEPVRACIAAGGAVDPALFVEGQEKCTPASTYMRNGRMSLQYQCTRRDGQVTHLADGQFKADSFEARVITSTYLAGPGDYELTRTFTGKRVGDCTATPAAAG